jgi:hypothetical protein
LSLSDTVTKFHSTFMFGHPFGRIPNDMAIA